MYPTKVFITLLSLFVIAISSGCGGGASVESDTRYNGNAVLAWNVPTTYSDGSPLSGLNIKGYRVYRRAPSGAYNPGVYYYVSAPTTSVYVKYLNIPVGQNYLVVTTIDISGVESGFSHEIFADLK